MPPLVKMSHLARTDRVKCVDLHAVEQWILAALHSGTVVVWNYSTQTLLKTVKVSDVPIRSAKFVARKHWIVTGSDDMQIRIFNYNTLEKIHQFEAHSDYLRSIVVHPTLPYIISSSDDMLVKMWDWDDKWAMKQSFEGHTHYIMQIAINPKDNNTFATASLDKTVKVWQFGSNVPNFTLEGHEKGVNCVDYYHGREKPYIISGGDDHLVKIWDYQNKTCVQTLDGHAQNVSSVCFHPELPLIITGSEDSTVKLWHANTYRLETTLNYGLERVWCIQAQKGANTVAIGYDEGSVTLKLGREEPAVSMDSSGKILWAKHSEIQQVNLKAISAEEYEAIQDGEPLPLPVKDLGSSEIYPQTLAHSSNGRFVAACGDGEYIVYTAMALRNKDFGQALEFVWATDPNMFAVRESATNVKIKKNFKDHKSIRSDMTIDGISGGPLLALRSTNSLCFFDWETALLIRRIEITAKNIYWSNNGEMVAICREERFFILRYKADVVNTASQATEDGIEEAFEIISEKMDDVKSGVWIGDTFVFTTADNSVHYYVGGEVVTIDHFDRSLYLLGFIESNIFACDTEFNVVSFKMSSSVLEYKTAIIRGDFDTADKILKTIPKEQKTRVALFLEKQGFTKQALAVSQDLNHKFDLSLSLEDLKTAHDLAFQIDSADKWKSLCQAATLQSNFLLAEECLENANDWGGLMLLATSTGSFDLLKHVAHKSADAGAHNVSFMASLLLGDIDGALDKLIETGRIPEAAFMARTHAPARVPSIVELWNKKASRSLRNFHIVA